MGQAPWEVRGFFNLFTGKDLVVISMMCQWRDRQWGEGGWRIRPLKSLRRNIRGDPQSEDPPRLRED